MDENGGNKGSWECRREAIATVLKALVEPQASLVALEWWEVERFDVLGELAS